MGRLKRAMRSRQCASSAARVEPCAGLRHDEGDDDLAPFGIGRADHRHLGHAGRRQQHLLDLARIDVGAAADQQVLAAVLQGEEAVVVQAADVAGPEPAVAQRRRPSPRGCASSRPSRVSPRTSTSPISPAAGSRPCASATRTCTGVCATPTDASRVEVARMRGVGDVAARQRRADHRRLALAVDLHEARPHHPQRALGCRPGTSARRRRRWS